MVNHFNKPQHQSPIGILVMLFDTLRQYAKALWPIIIFWVFKFDEINKGYLIIGTVSVFLIFGVIAYLKYINFTFYLNTDNEEFVVNEGIFNKTRTTIQLYKIQQVNINQSFIQKIIGVYSLDVDTAGSNKKECEIKAISHEIALALKGKLLDNRKKSIFIEEEISSISADLNEEAPFIKISFFSLIKVGITSNYIKSFSLLLLFFLTLSDYVNKFTGKDLIHDENIENYVNKELIFQVFFIFVFILFCVVLVINLVRIIFKYFDYKITKQKGSLLLSFGLLNTKSTIIKPEKVQITIISRNYFQKKMDILEMKIKQATSGNNSSHNSVIEIPGCNDYERDELLKLIFKNIPEKGVMLKPNFRKLGFAIFLTIGLPLLVYYNFRSYNQEIRLTFDFIIPIYVLFVGLIQYFKFKNYKLFVNDDFIIMQRGAWDIKNEIIEPTKIQAITTSQLFWHKSINIGSITLHTAGGNISFQLGNFIKMKQYVNLWLYQIETSDSNWM